MARVSPDSRPHVTAAGREELTVRAGGDADYRVSVALQHHLRITRYWIPELNATIFRSRHNPIAVWCETHRKYEVLGKRLVVKERAREMAAKCQRQRRG